MSNLLLHAEIWTPLLASRAKIGILIFLDSVLSGYKEEAEFDSWKWRSMLVKWPEAGRYVDCEAGQTVKVK